MSVSVGVGVGGLVVAHHALECVQKVLSLLQLVVVELPSPLDRSLHLSANTSRPQFWRRKRPQARFQHQRPRDETKIGSSDNQSPDFLSF